MRLLWTGSATYRDFVTTLARSWHASPRRAPLPEAAECTYAWGDCRLGWGVPHLCDQNGHDEADHRCLCGAIKAGGQSDA